MHIIDSITTQCCWAGHESRAYTAGRIEISARLSTVRKRTYMLQAPEHGPIADTTLSRC